MNTEELEIVGHSLGVNVYNAKVSKKRKHKNLPKKYYRNYFCANHHHSDMPLLLSLESQGFMARGATINDGRDTIWYVTDAGIAEFENKFVEYVNPS